MVADRADGSGVDIGRRSRVPTAAMRRAVAGRDRGCVFPGCEARVGTQVHHVQHWAKGGRTAVDNLATLCRFHHRRLHEGGFGMRRAGRPGGQQGWAFTRPDGRPIPALVDPPPPVDPGRLATLGRQVAPDACCSEWDGTHLDQWGLSVVIDGLNDAEQAAG